MLITTQNSFDIPQCVEMNRKPQFVKMNRKPVYSGSLVGNLEWHYKSISVKARKLFVLFKNSLLFDLRSSVKLFLPCAYFITMCTTK